MTVGLVTLDEKIIENLSKIILHNGYKVIIYKNLNFINEKEKYSFLIADLDMNKNMIIDAIKNYKIKDVILISTEKSVELIRKVYALGIADFIQKPVFLEEIIFKLKKYCPKKIRLNDIEIDFYNKIVSKNGELVKLTQKESSLLFLLLQYKNRIVTYEMIRDDIYGYTYPSDNAIHLLVSRLKKKLKLNIISVPKEGYILKV
ncbi:response regulator transcription factor [Caminibacter pacificus]|uniref:DNA-binding response OmpR family regulator n=1 Tax=Caminibacter pacificus TaxID=1424653 RepID=A0AAJ4RDI9_9BACT|nr:winged helix-turn-helix domain-containing protein [Caminibacter pacificus]QCI28620.2 response regulator transcription factor [Caminibacter pacificus]ROR40651.1 DNA-binding response OmpR family regulator [Caminibacter pacificus]